MVVDEQKLIPSDLIRSQLSQAADLVVPLDLAPPSKQHMWEEYGSADKLLAMPAKRLNKTILKVRIDYFCILFCLGYLFAVELR